MYDDGIDLYMAMRESRVETASNARVLGHIGAYGIHVLILHHGVNGQGAPISHSLAKRE